MFTGLVLAVGVVSAIRTGSASSKIRISAPFDSALTLGESVACNGVCLTVTRIIGQSFEADASSETLARTTLKTLRAGSRINLERALTPTDRMGGHLVSGHVDGVGKLLRKTAVGRSFRLEFSLPKGLAPMVAEKGSITIDGISLTVNGCSPIGRAAAEFDVTVVPHTWASTTLSNLVPGTPVNLEVDLLARYVARLLEARALGVRPTESQAEVGSHQAMPSVETTLRAWKSESRDHKRALATKATNTRPKTARSQKDRA
jgi:riboflavin synthase